MKLNFRYYGAIAEELGRQEESLAHFPGQNVEDLEAWLLDNRKGIEKFPFTMAINQKVSREEMDLKDNDEISIFPPFAGG